MNIELHSGSCVSSYDWAELKLNTMPWIIPLNGNITFRSRNENIWLPRFHEVRMTLSESCILRDLRLGGHWVPIQWLIICDIIYPQVESEPQSCMIIGPLFTKLGDVSPPDYEKSRDFDTGIMSSLIALKIGMRKCQYDNLNTQSRGFKTWRDLVARRLAVWWIGLLLDRWWLGGNGDTCVKL